MRTARQRLKRLFTKPALRQGSLVLFDQGFLSLATFATGALLARATDKGQYSAYVLALSLILLLQGIHRALVSAPFTIYAPHLSERDRNIYQGSAFVHTLLLCALISAAMIPLAAIGGNSIPGATSSGLAALFPLLAVVTSSQLVRDFIRNALLARLHISAGVIASVLGTTAQFTLITWFFVTGRLTVANALLATAVTAVLAAGYMLWRNRGLMDMVSTRIWMDFLRSLRTGKWVLIDVFAYMAASQAYPWLLLYLLDPHSVAIFGVCSSFAGLTGPFLRGANAYIHPRMVHGYKDANVNGLARLTGLSVVAVSIPYVAWLLIGSVFANELLGLIYGTAYSGYAVLTILLLIRAAIEGTSSPLSAALQTLERADVVTVSLVLGACITLGLGWFLISNMGLAGAGLAAAVSSLATALWRWIMLRSILRRDARAPA